MSHYSYSCYLFSYRAFARLVGFRVQNLIPIINHHTDDGWIVRDPFDPEGWLFELKWGGFRAIAEKDRLGVRLYSRNQKDFTKRFPVMAHAVGALDNVILDGEIVALDEHGHPR